MKSEVRSPKSAISNPKGTSGRQSTIKNQKSLEKKRIARLTELETSIAALEQRLVELSRDLEAAGSDVARVKALGEEYAQVEAELSTRLGEWETMAA